MKLKHIIITGLSIITASTGYANIILNTSFGIATTSSNVPVPDSTLWVLIVDSNDNNLLPGGLQPNSSLVSSEDTTAITNTFSGASSSSGGTINLGQIIDGDTVFAWGGFNGLAAGGHSSEALDIAFGPNGVASGRKFGFYWFPGSTFTGITVTLSTGSLEVGGVHETASFDGMSLPGDSGSKNVGVETLSLGGSFPDSRMTAVAVPETSSLALSALGLGALLRRRRK